MQKPEKQRGHGYCKAVAEFAQRAENDSAKSELLNYRRNYRRAYDHNGSFAEAVRDIGPRHRFTVGVELHAERSKKVYQDTADDIAEKADAEGGNYQQTGIRHFVRLAEIHSDAARRNAVQNRKNEKKRQPDANERIEHIAECAEHGRPGVERIKRRKMHDEPAVKI